MKRMGSVSNLKDPSVAISKLTVDSSLKLPDIAPRVIKVCKDIIASWSELDDDCFSVETISGGITNLLLKVTKIDASKVEDAVTVRLYGPNTDYVIDREREFQATKHLSAAGFGAQLLGVFENGTIQAFINARTLTPSDIREPKIAAEIARQLRKFHEVDIPGSREPQLWHDIDKFYTNSRTLQFDDLDMKRRFETISFSEIHNEIKEIQALTNQLKAPVVYSHNDLLSGNFMLNDQEEKLYIIDFEYGSYSYRGYDIGNHFNEYAGYDCDYTLSPTKEEQNHFLRHYLDPIKPHEVSDEDIEALYIETNTYMLASHLFWALWALIQAKVSPIQFDYLGYFFLRYNEYKAKKKVCCCNARAFLDRHFVGANE